MLNFLLGYAGLPLMGPSQEQCAADYAAFRALPRRTLPVGTEWQRTGGKTWQVTIRREPETEIDHTALQGAYLRNVWA